MTVGSRQSADSKAVSTDNCQLLAANHMRHALQLAARNLGQTWPNPSVGALIVKGDSIVGRGWTARGGRPHAETIAIEQAGGQAQGATLYVTLEPCSHYGETPPCTDAIIAAGITRVVIACRDPNPKVNGSGIARLKAAGIEVHETICEQEAMALNAGFFSVITRARPYVAMKLATSLDGCMAHASGESKWITGEHARAYGHLLRSQYDAILTGIGTVLADDPLLTCRLPGMEASSPVRVVMDRQGRLPTACQLMRAAERIPVWVYESNIDDTLRDLAARGITRALVEAGPTLSTAFLKAALVDRLYWFRAPITIGGGRACIQQPLADTLTGCPRFTHISHQAIGNDMLDIFEIRH